jgi:hypothetical protein
LLPGIVSSADSAVVVRDAWIREAPPNAAVLAGYMIMENLSDESLSLVSASAAAFHEIMIHRTEQKGGMAQMTHQEQVIIPANGKVLFVPGGYHLMLMNPKQSLNVGDQVTVSFIFEDQSELSAIFKVRKNMPLKDQD